jgi:guanylate kinase
LKKSRNRYAILSRSGIVLVLTGPSGCGKTTVYKELLKKRDDISFSVSYTTRKKRESETHGVDYFFIDKDEFLHKVERGDFVEWAEVHGDLKGTDRNNLELCIKGHRACLLDIDVQGAMQIIEKYPSVVTIFVMAPSLEDLRKRLEKRGTESKDAMRIRLANAEKELEYKKYFHYIVVNDRVENAVGNIESIIEKEFSERR